MSIPRLFFGHYSSGSLMRVGEGYLDLQQAYIPLLVSNPEVLGDGTHREAFVSAIYLTVEQREEPLAPTDPYEEAVIQVIPIFNGKEIVTLPVTVRMQPINEQYPPKRVAKTYEVPVSLPRMRNGVEVGRYSPVGRFFQAKVILPATEIQIVEANVEFRPTTEGKTPATSAGVAT